MKDLDKPMNPTINKVRKAYGVFENLSLTIPVLLGEKSRTNAEKYFKKNTLLIRKGFDLIPNELKIRLVTQDDISISKQIKSNYKVRGKSNCIVEWTFSDEMDFVTKYNLIFKTQLRARYRTIRSLKRAYFSFLIARDIGQKRVLF